jgi:hypothetical protein
MEWAPRCQRPQIPVSMLLVIAALPTAKATIPALEHQFEQTVRPFVAKYCSVAHQLSDNAETGEIGRNGRDSMSGGAANQPQYLVGSFDGLATPPAVTSSPRNSTLEGPHHIRRFRQDMRCIPQ